MNKEIESITGPGGLAMVRIENRHARALISRYGGQVLSFQPRGEEEVLFVSSASRYERGQAIRGGIPVCWPWFGAHPENPNQPSHGFARLSEWELLSTSSAEDGSSRLELGLYDAPRTRSIWPHPFALKLLVTVGLSLTVELHAANMAQAPLQLTGALHTYLRVSEARHAHISGLDDTFYVDTLAGQRVTLQRGKLVVDEEINRIYRETENTCILHDPGYDRQIVVKKQGSRSTVVWNPWQERSAAIADLGDEEYRHMVCIEAANTMHDAVHLAPGQTHVLGTEIEVIGYSSGLAAMD